MGLTGEFISFLSEIDFKELPERVIEQTKYLLLDYLGVALGGSRSESALPVYRMIQRLSADGLGTVIGQSLKALPGYAALANGTAAHSLELDDTHQAGSLHPGVVVFSAAIAASEAAAHQVDGRQFITAVVAGYEAAARLSMAVQPKHHYLRGFHPTATCGVFGAAVTAARLWGLSREQTLSAFGIAGSMSAGSMEFLAEGAWTKRLHPGLAAQNGLQAMLLAAEGFRGPATIIEGRDGFLNSYSAHPLPELVGQELGRTFEILRTAVKPHACCRYKQAGIDGIIELATQHEIEPEQIRRIETTVLEAGFPLVCEPQARKYHPSSVVDAQFSMPFGAAVAAIYRRASLSEYTQETLSSPQVRELMSKVVMVKDQTLEQGFPAEWPARVVIELNNGIRLEQTVRRPKGDPENPLTWEELRGKFRSLAGPVLPLSRLREIEQGVNSLEQKNDLRAIWQLLQ